MAKRSSLPLLVVDGYNVLYADPRYEALFDEEASQSRLGNDPFNRARQALLADVAAFAQDSFDAVIVYDGANNQSDERPETRAAGVRVVFSRRGVSADSVIEELVTQAREAGRPATVVTGDATIQATVEGAGVTRMSSRMMVHEVQVMNAGIEAEREERSLSKMTLADRIDPATRAKLDALLGRRKG